MTIRIDTARNQITTTIDLLGRVLIELDDLHILAYEREVASDEIKVAGGARDYALDTHGDHRVRDAYRVFSGQTSRTCVDLEDAAHTLLRNLTGYVKGTKTGPRTTTALEYAILLEAKARRAARGEYQPTTRLPQPARDDAVKAHVQETERLNRLNRRLMKVLAEATDMTITEIEEQFDPREQVA